MGLPLIKAILGKCWEVFFIHSNKIIGYFFAKKYLHNHSVQSIESSVVVKTPRSLYKILKLG